MIFANGVCAPPYLHLSISAVRISAFSLLTLSVIHHLMAIFYKRLTFQNGMTTYQMERFKYFFVLYGNMEEKSAFLEFVGDTPFTRLLNFLIIGREFDYTLTDLANKAGISWTTLNRIFPKLREQNMVVEVRQVGRARLYKLNTNNPNVQRMIELHKGILIESLQTAAQEQLIEA